MRRPLLLALCFFTFVTRYATTLAAEPRTPLPYKQFTLPNGLKVLVHEDHTVPIVAVELFYHVGSKDEAPGKTGFAHLFEHLMFKGSRNVADGGHFAAVLEAGGTCNASTSSDRTNYFEIMPSSFLERALFLEADRMAHLLDGMTQKSLDNQRDVVRNERRQNYENRPYGSSVRPLAEALYPEGHPYHYLTIGDHADLERASLEDVFAFFRTYYRPGNATLAIAGDVDLPTAKRLVEAQFGAVPSDPTHPDAPPSSARTKRPPPRPIVTIAEEKHVDLSDRVSLERLTLAWPSPAGYQPGDAELDLLGPILGPESGRLHKRLVHDLQVAQNVSIGQDSGLLASHFEISVMLKPGHTSEEIIPIIDEELAHLADGSSPVTAAELTQAKTRVEAELYYGLASAIGRTRRLLGDDYLANDPGYFEKDLRRYRAVTAAQIQTAVRALGKGRVRMIVHPAPHAEVKR